MRNKFMSNDEFTGVQQHDWSPGRLSHGARPGWMKNMPTGVALASGSTDSGLPYHELAGGSGTIVGGIAYYRLAPDDPVDYNKDCYLVISGMNPSGLVVVGPSKDNEHWTNTIRSWDWDL
jgi:hypothetical protein